MLPVGRVAGKCEIECDRNSLDNLMLKYEDSNPDFFRDYMNARQIIDSPGGRGGGNPTPTPTELTHKKKVARCWSQWWLTFLKFSLSYKK
jgi:hypothetical protein